MTKKHVAKASPFGLKIKDDDVNSLLIIFNLFLGGIFAFRLSHGATLIQHHCFFNFGFV